MLYPCFASAQIQGMPIGGAGSIVVTYECLSAVHQKRKHWSSELLRSRPVGLLPRSVVSFGCSSLLGEQLISNILGMPQ